MPYRWLLHIIGVLGLGLYVLRTRTRIGSALVPRVIRALAHFT